MSTVVTPRTSGSGTPIPTRTLRTGLRRLAEAINDPIFGKQAVQALAAVSGRAASHGPVAAHYLLARRAVLR